MAKVAFLAGASAMRYACFRCSGKMMLAVAGIKLLSLSEVQVAVEKDGDTVAVAMVECDNGARLIFVQVYNVEGCRSTSMWSVGCGGNSVRRHGMECTQVPRAGFHARPTNTRWPRTIRVKPSTCYVLILVLLLQGIMWLAPYVAQFRGKRGAWRVAGNWR